MCQEWVPMHTRCHVFRVAPLVVDTAAGQETAVTGHVHGGVSGGGDGSGGEDGSIKPCVCVCSPSQHPGSFRCRQHQAKYVWRSRTMK